MEISLIGASFRTAPLPVRERLALSRAQAVCLLRECRDDGLFAEGFVLSTCNRTELYCVSPGRALCASDLASRISRIKGNEPVLDDDVFYRREGLEAVEHLFRVAASLDSQVIGEHEVHGQVRQAYEWAREAGTARFVLNRLIHRALRAGKRVRSETRLNAGAASVPAAAVNLARRTLGGLEGKTVLVVGAGRTAELAVRALLRFGAASVVVANRTPARARELVGRLAGPASLAVRAAPFCRLRSLIRRADLVIVSTAAPDYVLRAEDMPAAGEREQPLVVMDVSVPRNVDPDVRRLANVSVYDGDDLRAEVEENLRRRRAEVPRAEAIVRHEVAQFARWMEKLQVVPTIRELRRRIEQLRRDEVARRQGQFAPEDRDRLERFARALCKKILHSPIAYLQELTAGSDRQNLEAIETFRRIFDLPPPEEE